MEGAGPYISTRLGRSARMYDSILCASASDGVIVSGHARDCVDFHSGLSFLFLNSRSV